MTKSLYSRHSAIHHPRDKLVTYYLTCFDKRVQEMCQAGEPDLTENSPAEGRDCAEEQTMGASPVMGGM